MSLCKASNILAAAMVAALLTGTAAQVSQVTGQAQTPVSMGGQLLVLVVNTIAWVHASGARVKCTPTALVVAAIAPATVLTTAAVALRIPTIGRHCEP